MKVEAISIVNDICEKIVYAIQNNEQGVLLGWINNSRLVVTGCFIVTHDDDIKQFACHAPQGIDLNGTFGSTDSSELNIHAKHVHVWLPINAKGQPQNSTAHLQCILADESPAEIAIITSDEALQNLYEQMVLCHIVGQCEVVLTSNKGQFDFDLTEVIRKETLFHLPTSNVYILPNMVSEKCAKDIQQKDDKNIYGYETFSRVFKPTKVHFAECLTSDLTPVPIVKYAPLEQGVRKLPVFLEALCFINKDVPLNGLSKPFRSALHRQLYMAKKFIVETFPTSAAILPIPEFLHFFVPGWCHPVTVCLPANKTDQDLQEYRRNVLHSYFILPLDSPIFCRLQRCYKHPLETINPAFICPHFHVKSPKTNFGKMYLVDGIYSYHHYLQDEFNDDGWGCAYRSLQTIVSWLRYQGFTEKAIPTHPEIQTILVDAGERPESFIGSKQWIGAVEVSSVLNRYLNVTSKILNVGRGSEMESYGRQLAIHFEMHGSPIMIGGGVLAHTILGVSFSEVTGQTMFLILDPHYVGVDLIEKITKKGWCGWKGGAFWKKDAFYNLCMPQRPNSC